MEPSEARRLVRGAIDAARRRAAERRTRVDDASRAYDAFLSATAVPAFQLLAQALSAEGQRFRVNTPGDSVRLVAEFSPDDFVELSLDTAGDAPALVVHTSRGRGRRNVLTERAVFGGRPLADITDADIAAAVLEDLAPFLER